VAVYPEDFMPLHWSTGDLRERVGRRGWSSVPRRWSLGARAAPSRWALDARGMAPVQGSLGI
jgi:hypothetical protein